MLRQLTGFHPRRTPFSTRLTCLLLCASLVAIAFPTALAAGALKIPEPDYTTGDHFIYSGYTLSLLNSLEQEHSNDRDLVSITQSGGIEMTITILADESCGFGGYSGQCQPAELSHWVNVTFLWAENSTNYDNDSLQMNISTTVKISRPTGRSEWEQTTRTIRIESSFSGGGEDNLVEQEQVSTTDREAIGDWPQEFIAGAEWEMVETDTIRETIRTRSNNAVWNTAWNNYTESRQMIYSALNETEVSFDKVVWQTVKVKEQALGEDNYTFRYLTEDGYPARMQEFEGGILRMSVTLLEYEYYNGESHQSSSESNWGLPAPALWLTLIALVAASTTARLRLKSKGTDSE
jgi:hypothetical protein